jgi:hypothetical protein
MTMFAAPLLSIALEFWPGSGTLIALVGKWFVFWAVGVRLGLAGVRQFVQPSFTAKDIFKIADEKAWAIVRELGFANLALAIVGLASLVKPVFVLPAAIMAGNFYGAASVPHLLARGRTMKETIAMARDLFAFVMLAVLWSARWANPRGPTRDRATGGGRLYRQANDCQDRTTRIWNCRFGPLHMDLWITPSSTGAT